MKITQISLEHSNPSLGPHETVTTINLTATEEHLPRIEQFLDGAQLNSTISLRAYIVAVHQQKQTILDKVQENAPKDDLSCGGTISTLQIAVEGQKEIVLHDVYRQHSLSNFYPEFTKYMVAHGSKFDFSPWEERNPIVEPTPKPEWQDLPKIIEEPSKPPKDRLKDVFFKLDNEGL